MINISSSSNSSSSSTSSRTTTEKKYKIMVVDDNSENIKIIGTLLRQHAYRAGFATSGQQALEVLMQKEEDYDLVLLDVNMPGMNGFEACKHIREIPHLKEIPIIFLTANTEPEFIVQGFNSGGQDYVTKPFHGEELLVRISTLIELHESRKKLQQINTILEEKVKERTLELWYSNQQLEFTNRQLEQTNQELEVTNEQLEFTNQQLEQTNQQMDVTNQQLKFANIELERLDNAKDEFLGIISHELNTPLTGIISFTELLRELVNGSELIEMVDDLSTSVKRLHRFARKCLTITALRTSTENFRKEQVDLNAIIKEALVELDIDIQGKKHTINQQLPAEPCFISGNAPLLKSCFISLIDNAIKYTPPKGNLRVHLNPDSNKITVTITDNGPGFSTIALDHLFEPFSPGSTHVERNKGLGLHLVKMIADFHEASIQIENRANGASVVMEFDRLAPV